jgi:RNA polymerase sigma factor (sigma-70 family)
MIMKEFIVIRLVILKVYRGRFHSIYEHLKNKEVTLRDKDLAEFIDYIKWGVTKRFQMYGSQDLKSDEHLLENTVQEVLARIWAGIQHYSPELSTFKNWIDGLINNVIKEHFRENRKKSGQIPFEHELSDLLENAYFIPEKTVLLKEKMNLYKKAMQILFKRNRTYYQVLYYRCYLELSSEETSALCSCTKQDVYRNLNRAMAKLLSIINELENVHIYSSKKN